jgi:hypothetical protein
MGHSTTASYHGEVRQVDNKNTKSYLCSWVVLIRNGVRTCSGKGSERAGVYLVSCGKIKIAVSAIRCGHHESFVCRRRSMQARKIPIVAWSAVEYAGRVFEVMKQRAS